LKFLILNEGIPEPDSRYQVHKADSSRVPEDALARVYGVHEAPTD
jgi:hypothetical protein